MKYLLDYGPIFLGAFCGPILIQLWRERKDRKARERVRAFKAMGLDHLL